MNKRLGNFPLWASTIIGKDWKSRQPEQNIKWTLSRYMYCICLSRVKTPHVVCAFLAFLLEEHEGVDYL